MPPALLRGIRSPEFLPDPQLQTGDAASKANYDSKPLEEKGILTNLCPHILPHMMKLLIERSNLESRLSLNKHSPTDLVPGFLPMVIPIILLLKKTPFQWTTVTPGAFSHHDVAFTYLCPILPRLSTTLYVMKPNS